MENNLSHIQSLISFVNSHEGCKAYQKDGQLHAICEAVKYGEVIKVSEVIPATWESVRSWLGY